MGEKWEKNHHHFSRGSVGGPCIKLAIMIHRFYQCFGRTEGV